LEKRGALVRVVVETEVDAHPVAVTTAAIAMMILDPRIPDDPAGERRIIRQRRDAVRLTRCRSAAKLAWT
jgi:hypothetical protein